MPVGIKRIGIYNQQNIRVGDIAPGNLRKDKGKKLYSFGILADVHMQYPTAPEDFQTALTYLNQNADFVCICGDLTTNGTAGELAEYKQHVDTYAKIPVYAVAGNHEGRNASIQEILETYTGKPLYYQFCCGDDVFLMLGVKSNEAGTLFAEGELQWLYEALEANRSKRCFLFQHVRPDDGCGNALGIYTYDIWGGQEQEIFENLLRNYPNVVFFHGHSHLKFGMQQYRTSANIDRLYGCWSVHVPSVSVPRDTGSSVNPSLIDVYAQSEGYIVDVYETGIHLRGRDFVGGTFLPIASYWLDTPIQTVAPGNHSVV